MQAHLLDSWCRFINHMIARQCTAHPTRFSGAACLPQNPKADDLSHCLPELEYCHRELGFTGCDLDPDPAGDRSSPGMDDKYWDPVYAYCEKHQLPIIVHGTNCTDPRLKTIPHNYQIGFVWEQYLATQLLRTAMSSSASPASRSWSVIAAARSIASSRAIITWRRRI